MTLNKASMFSKSKLKCLQVLPTAVHTLRFPRTFCACNLLHCSLRSLEVGVGVSCCASRGGGVAATRERGVFIAEPVLSAEVEAALPEGEHNPRAPPGGGGGGGTGQIGTLPGRQGGGGGGGGGAGTDDNLLHNCSGELGAVLSSRWQEQVQSSYK